VARIPLCEVGDRKIGDRSEPICASVNGRIVRDHDHAIARLVDIELEHVDAVFAQRDLERGERILGRHQRPAPVRDV
jgi:hypothetical protein